jgi:hypothetical protein
MSWRSTATSGHSAVLLFPSRGARVHQNDEKERNPYSKGLHDGEHLPAYRAEPRVVPDSRTEPFVALIAAGTGLSEDKMARDLRRRSKRSRKTAPSPQRACLRCDRRFVSEGPHHRLCQACREFLAVAPTPVEEYPLRFL